MANLFGRLRARLRFLREQHPDEILEFVRHVWIEVVERWRIVLDDGPDRLDSRFRRKGPPPCDHSVKHDAETEKIGTAIDGGTMYLLWGHVTGRTSDHKRFENCRASRFNLECWIGQAFGQTEIEHFHFPTLCEQDVL